MSANQHYRRLERLYVEAPTNRYYRPEIQVGDGTSTVRIAVQEQFFHAAAAVHGSVYFKILDDAAFFAVASLLPDVFPLTQSFNLYFQRPVSAGAMIGAGKVVQRSRRLFVAESNLVDEQGRALARGSGTFMRSDVPWDELPNDGRR